jgi:hypothetical protein
VADFSASTITVIDETATAPLMEGQEPILNGDWTLTENAENRLGEIAVTTGNLIVDFDAAADGFVYSGVPGNSVAVKVKALDVDLAAIAPGATDTAYVAVFRNNEMIATADEGVLTEFDDEVVDEFNCVTYVPNVQVGDVIRAAFVQTSENEEFDLTVVNGGSLSIY